METKTINLIIKPVIYSLITGMFLLFLNQTGYSIVKKTPKLKVKTKTVAKKIQKPISTHKTKKMVKPAAKKIVKLAPKKVVTQVLKPAAVQTVKNTTQPKVEPTVVVPAVVVPITITVANYDDLFQLINSKATDKVVYNDDRIEKAYNKGKDIIGNIITPNMTDFEKEKTIHDYIIMNSKIKHEDGSNNSMYNVLIENDGTPSGYAQAVKLLMNLSGLECYIVDGDYNDETSKIKHTWNIVKISGKYYHLDAALDNTSYFVEDAAQNENLSYDYFNLSDESIASNHTWDKSKFPVVIKSDWDSMGTLFNDMLKHPNMYVIKGDWIYFANESTMGNLTKIKVDGTGKVTLFEDSEPVTDIYAVGDWLCYGSDFLYRINTITNERAKVSESMMSNNSFDYFRFYNGFVYYLEKDNNELVEYDIFKMDISNGNKTKLTESKLPIALYFNVYDNYIYYSTVDDNDSGLYRISLSDNKTSKIINGIPVGIRIENDWLIYSTMTITPIPQPDGTVNTEFKTMYYKSKLDGSELQQTGEPGIEIKVGF